MEGGRAKKICIVGLGSLGLAQLRAAEAGLGEFELAAGFDADPVRAEILSSSAPLFPAHKMPEVIARMGIQIAMLCVPAEAAQECAEICAAAGARGILNFAPVALRLPPGVHARDVSVLEDLRGLAAMMDGAARAEA
ncbi:MAG: hypothetical protein FWE09_04535 [Treponema sp.]|nr:hypothetical protein [Treponema sp.]